MSKLSEIVARVEPSMCMTYGTQHPEGREEARISKDDWEALKTIVVFYANHNHWMSLGEDGPQVLLVAHGDVPGVEGWSVAEGKPDMVLQ